MLEVQKEFKIRKDNLYKLVDRYKLTHLTLDLHTQIISIQVEFYKDGQLIHTRDYQVGECGDVDVNELIKNLHNTIDAKV